MDDGVRAPVVVMASADGEWRAMKALLQPARVERTPIGEWFAGEVRVGDEAVPVVYMQGGWGKIAAAASTQHAIDRWRPRLLVNLATCGGFAGCVERDTVILAERTLVYDIIEQMGDTAASIAFYSTDIDLSWLKPDCPRDVLRTLLISADRDLLPAEVPLLHQQYGAVAGDWESGAIAWVAARNSVRCLILRGVTDLVGEGGGEAYDGTVETFNRAAARVMARLLEALPRWLAAAL
ncbi:MAG: 5'-methylthioadenosine/S-adenosylhomocysteine nucleosidase family protein [Anaerolineae bacterium]